MKRGIEAMAAYFDKQEWPYEVDAEEGSLTASFKEDHGTYFCQARDDNQYVEFLSYLPTDIPKKKRGKIAETLCRMNCVLSCGSFEMDFEDGEVRCRTGLRYTEGEIVEELVDFLVLGNLMTMNTFAPAILAVALEGANPADAVAEVEKHLNDE